MKKLVSIILAISLLFSVSSFTLSADNTEDKNEPIFTEDFENGLDEWELWPSATEENLRLTEDAYSEGKTGVYFLDIANDTSTGITGEYIDVNAGETYTAMVDIYSISGSVLMYFKYFTGGLSQISAKSIKGTVGKWTTVKITEVAPEGASACQIVLCGNGTAVGEGIFDNVRLYEGDVTPSFAFDKAKAPEGSLVTIKGPEDPYKVGDVIFEEDFEDGEITGWRTRGEAKTEVSTEIANKSKYSVHICDDGDKIAGGIISKSYPVTAGEDYAVFADIYNLSGTLSIYVKYFDAIGTQLSNQSKGTNDRNFWSTVIFNTQAPENAATVQVWVYTSVASVRIGYVDNIKLVKGKVDDTPPEYEYAPPKQTAAVDASIVKPVNNKLEYTKYTDKGDIVGDFSYGGFYAGEFDLPVTENIPVALTLSPSGTDDDTEMLQSAINKVAAENTDGKMKVVKLKAGKYNINKSSLRIPSGILLSGEGQGPTGTILYAKDAANYFAVRIDGTEPVKVGEDALITDEYIPAGARSFNISEEAAKNFKAGDFITVYYPSTEEWSQAIGMNKLISSVDKDSSWDPGEVDLKSERIITAINGTKITVDFPLFVPNDKTYAQAYIYKTDDSGRAHDIGIENLRVESYYNGNLGDENHATLAVAITNAKNVFVRDVSAKFFYSSAVSCRQGAKQVSVVNCSSLQPASQITGSRRYSFAVARDTQQVLMTGCYSYDGRHDFEASFPSSGPVAYVDNVVDKSNSTTEAHGTWSNGLLYDNIYQIGNQTLGSIALANRGHYGTTLSQGWTSTSSVVWNCLASAITVAKPPLTYQNFVVGTFGIYTDEYAALRKESHLATFNALYNVNKDSGIKHNYTTKKGSPVAGDSYVENEFTPVEPRSLFKAQLSERFTGNIQNARPNAPIIVYPRSDKTQQEKTVDITGVYQMGAEAVTIYIDNEPHKATLNSSTNMFDLSVDLSEGVHKIYATQTINGVEGCKNADRFITIGKANGNPDYLQSKYEPEKTKMILNDTRVTFDKFLYGQEDVITVTVNNKRLQSDVAPYETQGRVLVPMRAIFETLNAEVSWDDATKTATAVKDGITVKITENQKTTYVNGTPYELDVPATITNGRFVVPVRFISESFGANVAWLDATKTVVINGK